MVSTHQHRNSRYMSLLPSFPLTLELFQHLSYVYTECHYDGSTSVLFIQFTESQSNDEFIISLVLDYVSLQLVMLECALFLHAALGHDRCHDIIKSAC